MSEITIRLYNSNAKTGQSASYHDLDVDHLNTSIKAEISTVQNDEIGKIFSLGSQEFALPSTIINDDFFKYTFDAGSDEEGLTFKKRFKSQILLDGGVAADGYLYYNGVTTTKEGKTVYKCTFNDSVPALGDLLKDVSLGDLDWTDYDHIYNVSNITSSWDGNLFSGDVIYPNVFYGYNDGETNYEYSREGDNSIFNGAYLPYTDFKPAVRVKTILDKIFNSIGLGYSSSFFSSASAPFGIEGVTCDDLYVLATPSDQKGVIDNIPQYALINGTSSFAPTPGTVASQYTNTSFSGVSASWADINTNVVEDSNGMYDLVTGTLTTPANGNYAFENVFRVINTSGTQNRILYWYYLKNGFIIPGATGQVTVPPSITTTINASVLISNLLAGQDIEFRVDMVSATDTILIGGLVLEIENLQPVPDTTFLDLQLADINSLEFIKGIQEQFNLILWVDKDNPLTIKIEPYDVWVNNGRILDWSDKVDYLQGIEIIHPSYDAEEILRFQNSEDENDYSLGYLRNVFGKEFGSYAYESDSDYSSGERVIGEALFAPTVIKPIKASSNVSSSAMVIPHINDKDDDNIERPIKFKPRLLFNNGKKQIIDAGLGVAYGLRDELGTQIQTPYYLQTSPLTKLEAGNDKFDLNFAGQGYWWHSDDISGYGHWTNLTAFNWFWSNRINQIYRNPARKVTLNIKFNPTDIFDFNLNDTISIDGQEYLINKISGFNFLEPQSTKVELIKKLSSPERAPIFTIGGNDPLDPNTPIGIGTEVVFDENEDGTVTPIDANSPTDVVPVSDIPSAIVRRQGYIKNSSGQLKGQVPTGKSSIPSIISVKTKFGSDNKQQNNVIRSITDSIQVKGKDNQIGINSSKINLFGNSNLAESNLISSFIVGDSNDIKNQNSQIIIIASGSSVDALNKNIQNIGSDYSIISGSYNEDVTLLGLNTAITNPSILQGAYNRRIFIGGNYNSYLKEDFTSAVGLINNNNLYLNSDFSQRFQNTFINNLDTTLTGSGLNNNLEYYVNNSYSDLNNSGIAVNVGNQFLCNSSFELKNTSFLLFNSFTNNVNTILTSSTDGVRESNIAFNKYTTIDSSEFIGNSAIVGNKGTVSNDLVINAEGIVSSQINYNSVGLINGVHLYSTIEGNYGTGSVIDASANSFIASNYELIAAEHDNALILNNVFCDLTASQSDTTQTSYINNKGLKNSSVISGSLFINNRKDDATSPSTTFSFTVEGGSTYINHTSASNPDKYGNSYNASAEQYKDSVVLGKTWSLGAEYAGFEILNLNTNDTHSITDVNRVILVSHTQNAGGYIFIELPDISTQQHDGRVITIKSDNSLSSTYRLRVQGYSGQTIDGSATKDYATGYSLLKVMAIKGTWLIIG